ncbi:hypothetical protein ACOSP7_008354 [Xanthoceras sorbifolium]
MSLFWFPKGFIKDLHRVCAAFWFRDFGAFSQAFIGKQCWRILKEPSLLATRVLKSCYFPGSSLLKAKAAPSDSLAWKSLIWGRDLVSKGARWQIGNGLSVFMPSDVECILSIPYSGLSLMDSLQWHFSKDGHYSVRLGYHLAAGLVPSPICYDDSYVVAGGSCCGSCVSLQRSRSSGGVPLLGGLQLLLPWLLMVWRFMIAVPCVVRRWRLLCMLYGSVLS